VSAAPDLLANASRPAEDRGHAPGPGVVVVRPAGPTDTRQRLPNVVGISAATAGSVGIGMNLVVVPAGGAAAPHSHAGFETAIYVLRGRIETRWGDGVRETSVVEAGDFLYIAPGVPHQPVNLSDSEDALAVVARNTATEQETVVPYDG